MAEDPRSGLTNAPGVQRSLELFRENPAVGVTLVYAAATIIGMVSSAYLFGRFGVNIFRYAQLGDFLIAALRYPLASFSILLAVPVVMLLGWMDQVLERRFPSLATWAPVWLRRACRSLPAYVVYFAAYAWVAADLSSELIAEDIRSGDPDRQVRVQLQSGGYGGAEGPRRFTAALLGTTAGYVFVYDSDRDRVVAIPSENLATLELERAS